MKAGASKILSTAGSYTEHLAEKAMKRAKAKDAVAQAKEASIYFDYD